MKLVVAIIAVLLFCFGATICNLSYDPCNRINDWWDLRMNLYSVLFSLCFLFSTMRNEKGQIKHIKFVLGIGVGLSISDVIDRLVFNINTFTATDIIMIIATIIFSYTEAYTQLNDKFKAFIQKLCHH